MRLNPVPLEAEIILDFLGKLTDKFLYVMKFCELHFCPSQLKNISEIYKGLSPTAQIWRPATSCFSQKLTSPLKRKRFQTVDEIQENMTRQMMATGGTVGGPKMPALMGTEASLSFVKCVLYLVSSSINVSVFYITWLDIIWTEVCPDFIYINIYYMWYIYKYLYKITLLFI